jgi:hypothetical protein
MRWCLLAILAAALLVAPSAAAQTIDAPDLSTLGAIQQQVSAIRGLQPLADPELEVLDAEGIRDYLRKQFDRDYLPQERELDQKAWVALGLIRSTDDLTQIELSLLSDQVVGVYDPDAQSMVVLGNEAKLGPAEKVAYAHEFNHALQDQYFGLNKLAPKHGDTSDHSMAVHALIEGDAVLLQTMWASAILTPEELLQLARGSAGGDVGIARAPLVVRSELLFPYVDGFNFVRQAYRQAGNSYSAVDELFQNPPESTAQLLHPEKYSAHVHPVAIQLPDVAEALGWRKVGSNVLGELDTRVLLEQWGSDHAEAARAAGGWAGDRYQVVERDGRAALVIRWTWESPDAAATFFSAYARGLRQRFDAARVEESSNVRQALTTPINATDVRLQGTDVLAVIAFDRDTANAIVGVTSAPTL